MAKSEIEKKFTAWERKVETVNSCLASSKWYFNVADEYEAEGNLDEAKLDRKLGKEELRKAEKYQAEADAMYTDDVKKEHEARGNFLNAFALFIDEWAVKFVDIEEAEFNKRKAANNAMWDAFEASGINRYDDYWKTDIAKTYKEKYGNDIMCGRIKNEYNRERGMKNMMNVVKYDVLKMRYRVVEYVGTPTGIEYVSWGDNGELEGVVTGTDGKCYLRGILAGGWNIQRLHIRMIVTKLS